MPTPTVLASGTLRNGGTFAPGSSLELVMTGPYSYVGVCGALTWTLLPPGEPEPKLPPPGLFHIAPVRAGVAGPLSVL